MPRLTKPSPPKPKRSIAKCPTGIAGLDQITEGGLPKGRPTLICGAAGCGKTILAMEFLVRGITEFGEPGLFVAFEESVRELGDNVASMGFDLDALTRQKKLIVEHVRIERSEILETGDYDLEGLFIRLGYAIDSIGAKRVVLDTIESLFSGLTNTTILRAELRRLFQWLKTKGVTAVITGEGGEGELTRHGIEEYVADCVILLDHRVNEETSVRRIRVLKYRGTTHGTNQYPFLIGKTGLSVLPLSSLRLEHKASTLRISSGVPSLDEMLGGKGFLRGTSILISVTAGTGKSSLAAHFVQAACRRRERAFYMASEQSRDEVLRNMRSIGIDLAPLLENGTLRFYAARPGMYGLEKHLVTIHDAIADFDPQVVVIDPITNFSGFGDSLEVKSMITRLIDLLKSRQITAMFTSLTSPGGDLESSDIGVSSLMDAWILLRELEFNGERNRGLYVLKARGMAHSNRIREFELTDDGARLLEVCLGPSGVLTGSARVAQLAQAAAEATRSGDDLRRKQADLELRRQELEMRIAQMRTEFESDERALAQERTAGAGGAHRNGRP